MLQSLNPAAFQSRTEEILSRYRPIAPKPDSHVSSPSQPRHILQDRPVRTRKRTRVAPPARPDLLYQPLVFHPSPAEAPEEKDFLQQLEEPRVIAPQPVRPVGSTINVDWINPDSNRILTRPAKRASEVQEEVEHDPVPAVITDSSNRVRMANSAYKEMVGQPECAWMDTMGSGSKCRRIGGGVMLRLSGSGSGMGDVYSGLARIEWGQGGSDAEKIHALYEAVRFNCERDYVYVWKFHACGNNAQ